MEEVKEMADERKQARELWERVVKTDENAIYFAGDDIGIDSPVELEEFLARLEYLGYELGWLDQEDAEAASVPDDDGWVRIDAGSEYGNRTAWYEIVGGVLVLRDEGDHDNLAGNHLCLDFEGLTLEQAYAKASAISDEPVRHAYDGCHLCKFSIGVEEVGANDLPDFLTYEEPAEAEQLRELIQAFLSKKASFADLRAAIG